MKAIHCPCGEVVEANTDDELVKGVEQHIQEKHPDMVGQYSREQILSMAHEH
jgi:predicted small metal-binding protein